MIANYPINFISDSGGGGGGASVPLLTIANGGATPQDFTFNMPFTETADFKDENNVIKVGIIVNNTLQNAMSFTYEDESSGISGAFSGSVPDGVTEIMYTPMGDSAALIYANNDTVYFGVVPL